MDYLAKYLEDDKLIDIFNKIDDIKHKTMSLIQIFSAARVNDVLSIRRESITEETYDGAITLRIVTIGKGNKQTTVYIFDVSGYNNQIIGNSCCPNKAVNCWNRDSY